MRNRKPRYPGRIKLIPVSGQPNTFDVIRADEPTEIGTPLNMKTLLSDETAAGYGLTPDTAVPDNIFSMLINSAVVATKNEYGLENSQQQLTHGDLRTDSRKAIAYGNNTFVSTAYSFNSNPISYCNDLADGWHYAPDINGYFSQPFYAEAFKKFYIMGETSIMSSSDGITWTSVATLPKGSSATYSACDLMPFVWDAQENKLCLFRYVTAKKLDWWVTSDGQTWSLENSLTLNNYPTRDGWTFGGMYIIKLDTKYFIVWGFESNGRMCVSYLDSRTDTNVKDIINDREDSDLQLLSIAHNDSFIFVSCVRNDRMYLYKILADATYSTFNSQNTYLKHLIYFPNNDKFYGSISDGSYGSRETIVEIKNDGNLNAILSTDVVTFSNSSVYDTGFVFFESSNNPCTVFNYGIVSQTAAFNKLDGTFVSSAFKIATGSYAGTGASGGNNKNKLTFDFIPAVLMLASADSLFMQLFIYNMRTTKTTGSSTSGSDTINIDWVGTSVQWSSSDAEKQGNAQGETYFYCAIGR